MTRTADLSIGIAAALGPDTAAAIAPAVERAGFHALWVNDTPGADALAVLAAAAAVTERLVLATGVLAVDRRDAPSVLADVQRLSLPEERLVLGIGAGAGGPGSLDRVRAAAGILASESAARVMIGALGPRMRRLAAESSDGPLLSWLTPRAAAEQAGEARAVSPDTRVVLYARAAVDPAAHAALAEEAARYAAIPSYAANLARLGVDASDTVLPQPGDDGIAAGTLRYSASVDELVLRAVTPEPAVESYLRFVGEASAARG